MTGSAPSEGRGRRAHRNGRRRAALTAYLFVLPAVVMYSVFVLFPLGRTIHFSLTDWNGIDPTLDFVGLQNYITLLDSSSFWNALWHNIYWVVLGSIGAIGLGLFLAVLVSRRPAGFHIYRTVFFMPQVLGPVIVGIIWLMMYAPRRGFFYQVGDTFGLDFLLRSPLANSQTSLTGVLVASIWASIGFFFVIFLAGLQNVDRDLLDAARVDGANGAQRFRFVIVPQLAPVITTVIALGMINSLRLFDIVWAMTQGGPGNSSEVLGTLAYEEAFKLQNQGYGSAIVVVTSALAIVLSMTFIKLRERGEG
jgi:ABC-type sugar transport system permease subunit